MAGPARQHRGPHDPLVADLQAEFGLMTDFGFSNLLNTKNCPNFKNRYKFVEKSQKYQTNFHRILMSISIHKA
jgi:hypothetical protein